MILAFHLGRVYTLSLAELISVFQQKQIVFEILELHQEVLLIKTDADLDIPSLQKRLGGSIKIIEILDKIPRKKLDDFLSFTLKDYFHPNILKSHFLKQSTGKIQIGVSIYPLSGGLRLFGQNKRIGMDMKQRMQDSGMSCRIVIPEGAALALPSVAVTNNQLLEKGAEIDLLVSDKQIYIGRTVTVQDFADYGRRDYQRPLRDARVGMLPPKVAQIMINLAQVPEEAKTSSEFVFDPFCGSGTVLQEALLMGYRVLGSDISQKAIDSTDKNLNWIRTRYKLPLNRFELVISDVKQITDNIGERKIAAIVTEGTLGPAYSEPPPEKEIRKNFESLSELYVAAFRQFHELVRSGTRLVIALPAYQKKSGIEFFPAIDKIQSLGYDIGALLSEDALKQYPFLRVTPRKSIIYDRKDQVVVREIISFIKR